MPSMYSDERYMRRWKAYVLMAAFLLCGISIGLVGKFHTAYPPPRHTGGVL